MNNLVRYANADPLFGIFEDFFRPTTIARTPTFTNRQVRVEHFDNRTEISVAAPGVAQSSFNVDLSNNTITIGYTAAEDDDTYFTKSSYTRSWRVAEGTTPDDITATYENGILMVTIARPEVDTTTTSIPVS